MLLRDSGNVLDRVDTLVRAYDVDRVVARVRHGVEKGQRLVAHVGALDAVVAALVVKVTEERVFAFGACEGARASE